jgi:putative ABC transport system ATP-binding protein
MPLPNCPHCNKEIDPSKPGVMTEAGLVTTCPHCKGPLGEQFAAALAGVAGTDDMESRLKKKRLKEADLSQFRDETATTHEFIVRTKDLVKTYTMGDQRLNALDGVHLDIRRGEYISIMGPSGSGKSTLFNMVGGLDKPTSGTVFIDEVDMAQLDAFELAWLRCRKIGYIFQTFNLIPVMTALENVTLPMIFAGMTSDEMIEKGVELLGIVGLGDRLHHKPHELSGGQQQRVAVARALANSPAIVLADEPTGNLDLRTGKEIIDLLRRLNEESGVTIISATHDLKMIDVSDRVVHIRDGKIERIDRRADIALEVGTMEGGEA